MYKVSHEMTLSKCDTTAHLSSHPYECRPSVCEHLCSAHTPTHTCTYTGKASTCFLQTYSCRYTLPASRDIKNKSSLLLIFSSWCMCGYTFFIWHTPAAACMSLIYAAHRLRSVPLLSTGVQMCKVYEIITLIFI